MRNLIKPKRKPNSTLKRSFPLDRAPTTYLRNSNNLDPVLVLDLDPCGCACSPRRFFSHFGPAIRGNYEMHAFHLLACFNHEQDMNHIHEDGRRVSASSCPPFRSFFGLKRSQIARWPYGRGSCLCSEKIMGGRSANIFFRAGGRGRA
jgi:hypothetical protein